MKIPFYNILNMFLTGFIFLGCFIGIFPEKTNQILTSSLVSNLSIGSETILTVSILAIVYGVGLTINRLGSVLVELILKGTKAIPFNDDYKMFCDAKKKYPIMDTLSREYALSRTGITLFIILTITSLFRLKWILSIIFILITVIYFFSCRKHVKKNSCANE